MARQTTYAKRQSNCDLYWVTTKDHGCDWLIFARTMRSAAKFHETYEGYFQFEATAELVIPGVALDSFSAGLPPIHAQEQDLAKLGFRMLADRDGQRVVSFEGRVYKEGCSKQNRHRRRARPPLRIPSLDAPLHAASALGLFGKGGIS